MLEFLLSRSMFAVTGVFILAVATGAITNLDKANCDSMAQSTAERFAIAIADQASMDQPGRGIIRVGDFVPGSDWTVEILPGFVTVAHESSKGTAPMTLEIGLDGCLALKVSASDRIVVDRTFSDREIHVEIHVEKVDATSETASANFLQSSRLL